MLATALYVLTFLDEFSCTITRSHLHGGSNNNIENSSRECRDSPFGAASGDRRAGHFQAYWQESTPPDYAMYIGVVGGDCKRRCYVSRTLLTSTDFIPIIDPSIHPSIFVGARMILLAPSTSHYPLSEMTSRNSQIGDSNLCTLIGARVHPVSNFSLLLT